MCLSTQLLGLLQIVLARPIDILLYFVIIDLIIFRGLF
jgi:hypothetical protein